MNKFIVIAIILFFLYAGIELFLVAFGFKTPRFKSVEQEQRFMNMKKKYGLFIKFGAISFFIFFIGELISSGVLRRLFS